MKPASDGTEEHCELWAAFWAYLNKKLGLVNGRTAILPYEFSCYIFKKM